MGFSTRSNALIPGHTSKWTVSATDSTSEANQEAAGLKTIRRTERRIGLVVISGVVSIAMALGMVVATSTALLPVEAARSFPDFQFANWR